MMITNTFENIEFNNIRVSGRNVTISNRPALLIRPFLMYLTAGGTAGFLPGGVTDVNYVTTNTKIVEFSIV